MNLGKMDLNLLLALNALLRDRNVTKAGESIGLSQPAMSNALSRLRKLFGDELLVRVGRSYELTPLASELLQPVNEILLLIDETVQRKPEFNPASDPHTFNIAATDYATYIVLQPLLERVSLDAPNVSLYIAPLGGSVAGQPAQIESGEADLIIRPAEIETSFPKEVLFHDRWVCAAWSGLEEIGDELTLEQYLSLPHLAYGMGPMQMPGLADQALAAMHVARRVELTIQSFFLLPFLIKGTRLITLIHERMGKRIAKMADVRLFEPPFETAPISEAMIWHPRRTSDPAHRWLRDQLMQIGCALENETNAEASGLIRTSG